MNIIKDKQIKEICKLIILRLSYKQPMSSSFGYRNIFLNSLGLIVNESFLVEELEHEKMVTHEGIFENSNFYKNISTTEKGKKYFLENINKISIPTDDLSLKIDKIKMYLGIDNV